MAGDQSSWTFGAPFRSSCLLFVETLLELLTFLMACSWYPVAIVSCCMHACWSVPPNVISLGATSNNSTATALFQSFPCVWRCHSDLAKDLFHAVGLQEVEARDAVSTDSFEST